MDPPGPLLASGRDADIFEYGTAKVLRRSREGRPMHDEAATMAALHALGYPVPELDSVSDDGLDLVMERIDGPTMFDAIGRAPWTLRRNARVLCDLHVALHELVAPPTLRAAPVGAGDRVLHMDLHPLNVLLAARGPVVIDWANACRGEPAVDVCVAWVLMASAEIPGNALRAKVLGLGRSVMVSTFLSRFDRTELAASLRATVEWKLLDPHMGPHEVAAMRALADREARPRP